ncbi:hypothetical protein [Gloeothece verrucosa]|uniref:Uncharacterized protein n=1 Tax=Gloeothece verrucosa (strain PCC 7822) TaxID=497965 RepID=E0U5G4_GLOV7|nr:hypothetical protein [Gloeothece verrucosa]ADN13554.1 conserved hypothetical protein [Gloeothece verrucosa PCC 7822]
MPEEPKQPSSINPNQISQGEMAQLLQKTIGQLEIIVNKLSTESLENLPPREVVETLTSNTEVLAELFNAPASATVSAQPQGVNVTRIVAPEEVPQEILFNRQQIDIDVDEPTEPVRVQPPITSSKTKKSKGWWGGIINSIRSLLPAALGNQLGDWAITGILSIVVVGVVLVSVVLVNKATPSDIAQTSPIPKTPAPIVTSSPSETSEPIVTASPSETPEVISTPPEIQAPGNPVPVEFAPPPEPELTPEQSLIASIQEQVTELTRQYPEALIATIEANFLGSQLIVTMGNEWYSLSPSRQNSLANAIFERSRGLDFRKLELIDQQGITIARSPVVGEEMVILQRQKNIPEQVS